MEYYSFKNFLIFGPFCVVKQKEPFGLKGTAKEGAQAAWWTKPSSFSPARVWRDGRNGWMHKLGPMVRKGTGREMWRERSE